MNIALLTAGGSGTRMQQELPKQFMTIHGVPIIVHTMLAFQRHPGIDAILVVCLSGWEGMLRDLADQYGITKLKHVCPGGANGQSSIKNGLDCLKEAGYAADDIVLIHDGNRTMVSRQIISDCIETTLRCGTAIAAIPCAEAMLTTDDRQVSTGSYPREHLLRTQTPHGFPLGTIWAAHDEALARGITNTAASCVLLIELGRQVHFYQGSEKNLKLTTPDDIELFEALLGAMRDAR